MATLKPKNVLPPLKPRAPEPINNTNNLPSIHNTYTAENPLPPDYDNALRAHIYPKLPGLVPNTTNNDWHESDDNEPQSSNSDQPKPVIANSLNLTGVRQQQQPSNITDILNNSRQYTTRKAATTSVTKPQTYLIWSIISTVVLFPTLFWIGALIFSLKSRSTFKQNEHRDGKKWARVALGFNIMCIIVACIGAIALYFIVNRDSLKVGSSSSTAIYDCNRYYCWTYCRTENSSIIIDGYVYNRYWTCYSNFNNYQLFQFDARYVYCLRKPINSVLTFLCQNVYYQ